MAEPSAEQLRSKAAEITARPDYDLEAHRADVGWVRDLLHEVLSWLIRPFAWIYDLTEGLPEFFRWVIIGVLLLVALALVWHILYTVARAVRGDRNVRLAPEAARRAIDPAEWERRAAEAAAAGDYITAVRYTFRAALGRLEQSEKKPYRPGTTNRELLKRYRHREEIAGPLRQFVETIDRKWYGDEFCTADDYAECATAHAGLRRAVSQGAPHAVGA